MKDYIEEKLTLAEFSEKFLGNADFKTPAIYDLSGYDIEVFGHDLKTGKDLYKPIKSFIIKEGVNEYYTDDKLNGTNKHRIIENGNDIFLSEHPEFKKIKHQMDVVDIEVEDIENYYANGRLNHNTTSGGKALGFHASVRIRLKNMGKIMNPTTKEVIGMKMRAQVVKNRLGPPMRHADFNMYFESGIDDNESWLNVLKLHDIAKFSGAWGKIDNEKGEEIKFQTKQWPEMMENEDFKKFLYDKICKAQILEYKKPPAEVEIILDEEPEDD